jgi:hypothetical protein
MSVKPMQETWKHQNVFETYLLLGPSRTLPALSEATGISHHTLQTWSKRLGWSARMVKRDEKAMAAISAENDKLLQTVIKRRHQQAYQAIQDKALTYLTNKKTSFSRSKSPARDAAIALDIGVKGERDVLGLRDTKIKGALVKEGLAAMIEVVMGS